MCLNVLLNFMIVLFIVLVIGFLVYLHPIFKLVPFGGFVLFLYKAVLTHGLVCVLIFSGLFFVVLYVFYVPLCRLSRLISFWRRSFYDWLWKSIKGVFNSRVTYLAMYMEGPDYGLRRLFKEGDDFSDDEVQSSVGSSLQGSLNDLGTSGSVKVSSLSTLPSSSSGVVTPSLITQVSSTSTGLNNMGVSSFIKSGDGASMSLWSPLGPSLEALHTPVKQFPTVGNSVSNLNLGAGKCVSVSKNLSVSAPDLVSSGSVKTSLISNGLASRLNLSAGKIMSGWDENSFMVQNLGSTAGAVASTSANLSNTPSFVGVVSSTPVTLSKSASFVGTINSTSVNLSQKSSSVVGESVNVVKNAVSSNPVEGGTISLLELFESIVFDNFS